MSSYVILPIQGVGNIPRAFAKEKRLHVKTCYAAIEADMPSSCCTVGSTSMKDWPALLDKCASPSHVKPCGFAIRHGVEHDDFATDNSYLHANTATRKCARRYKSGIPFCYC